MWTRNWKLRTRKWKLEAGNSASNSRFAIRIALAVFLAGLVAASANATTPVRMSLEQLSQLASDIVRGHVVSLETRWNESNTQIVTLTTIAVGQRIKGRAPVTVVVEQPGGTLGNIRSRVPGTVQFHQGEDYVLFLEPARANSSRRSVVGMMQGAYRIYRDAATAEERVIYPFSKYAERDQATEPMEAVAEPPVGAETISLSQFRQQLSTALAAPRVIPKGTSIPLVIETTEFEGVGRMHVMGRTTSDLFPNTKTVIPAGSFVEGNAQRWQGVWKIYWTQMSVPGASIAISATSEEFSQGLRGRSMLVRVN
jgi:hypothetical protein